MQNFPVKSKDDKIDISKYNLVMVEWLDIISDCDWASPENVLKMEPCVCIEVGWIIYEDKKKVVIVSQVNDTDMGNRTILPKSVIKKITKL